MATNKKSEFCKALQIGIICISAYMVRYYTANLLTVTSPEMLSSGEFSKELLGTLSSITLILYAIGQLINGVIGDIVKPKIMITGGILITGLSCILFSLIKVPFIVVLLFAVMGFSRSMLRGPLVKTISENTTQSHSRVICTFFSFAGFSGPLIASLISIFFDWQKTFFIGGVLAIIIGITAYTVFSIFEINGKITFVQNKKSSSFKSIFTVFSLRHFMFYMCVGGIAEISGASIGFWTPTFFSEHLNMAEDVTKIVFSAMSVIKSSIPFIALFIFTFFGKKDIRIIRVAYVVAAIFFVGMIITDNPIFNVLFLLLAQMAIGITSSLLWSIYIPAQRESGMVSTINGVFDFTGYIFAAIANMLFAGSISGLGWNGTILIWLCMVLAGFAVSLITKEKQSEE